LRHFDEDISIEDISIKDISIGDIYFDWRILMKKHSNTNNLKEKMLLCG
jgi:hypothetical protein